LVLAQIFAFSERASVEKANNFLSLANLINFSEPASVLKINKNSVNKIINKSGSKINKFVPVITE
jgi:hypothetical protein